MPDKIYLSPAVADAVEEGNKRVIRELKALRKGFEGNMWDSEVNPDEIDEDEDE